jgi:hypothetical protein
VGLNELKECIILPSFIGSNNGENSYQMHSLEEVIPEVGELDELETFIGSKKTKFGCGRQ